MTLLNHDPDLAALGIDRRDTPDRAVEHQLLVVVAQLDNAVALAQGAVARADLPPPRIYEVLQLTIQRMHPERPAIHRRQHVNLARIPDSEPPDQPILH